MPSGAVLCRLDSLFRFVARLDSVVGQIKLSFARFSTAAKYRLSPFLHKSRSVSCFTSCCWPSAYLFRPRRIQRRTCNGWFLRCFTTFSVLLRFCFSSPSPSYYCFRFLIHLSSRSAVLEYLRERKRWEKKIFAEHSCIRAVQSSSQHR